jgi:YfiR/HmsC-like
MHGFSCHRLLLRFRIHRSLVRLARSVATAACIGSLSLPAAALSHEEWVSAFVRFVEWPVPASIIDGPLVVCHQHNAPALALDGQQVRGLTLKVRRLMRPQHLAGCHIFASFAGDEASWTPWLKAASHLNLTNESKARPSILVVGQGGQFCDLGGAICLVSDPVTGASNYRLNLDTLSRAGFRVDTQLLRSQPSRPAKAE